MKWVHLHRLSSKVGNTLRFRYEYNHPGQGKRTRMPPLAEKCLRSFSCPKTSLEGTFFSLKKLLKLLDVTLRFVDVDLRLFQPPCWICFDSYMGHSECFNLYFHFWRPLLWRIVGNRGFVFSLCLMFLVLLHSLLCLHCPATIMVWAKWYCTPQGIVHISTRIRPAMTKHSFS